MEHSVYPRCTQRATMEANTMQETALLELRGICKFFPGVPKFKKKQQEGAGK